MGCAMIELKKRYKASQSRLVRAKDQPASESETQVIVGLNVSISLALYWADIPASFNTGMVCRKSRSRRTGQVLRLYYLG